VVDGVKTHNNESNPQPIQGSTSEDSAAATVSPQLITNNAKSLSRLTKWQLWRAVFLTNKAPKQQSDSASGGTAIAKWLFWIAVVFLTTTVSALLGATLALVTPLSSTICPPERCAAAQTGSRSPIDLWRDAILYRVSRPVNILVMGIDRVPDVPTHSAASFNGRSDTMLLVRLDPRDNSVKILSIPRDTQVDSPELSLRKINQANADGGPALAARIVSSNLNDVPIDRYIRVTTDAFSDLVDLVGGVEVFVPQKMHYVDKTQQLEINLDPGWQLLNGEQAEQFARFRSDSYGDIGRVQRQQVLMKALRQRLVSPTMLPRLPQMMRMMQKYVDTNINLEEMLALANFSLKLDRAEIKMVMLPGQFSGDSHHATSYWMMNQAGRDRIMQDYFSIEPKSFASLRNRSEKNVRIAIQNASGQPNMSRRVAQYLKGLGFHNLYLVRDWPDPERETQIIVQQGDIEAAKRLKGILGLGNIEAASTGDIESDLTLRIGEDWPDYLAGF
jgi:polyisoprenyl-teichoic acid--peptidoglycan teichoic acid transferase